MKYFLTAVLMLSPVLGAEKKLKMEDLPASVKTTVTEQIKGATLVGITKETEKGKTVYEVETTSGGKSRDLMIDSSGAVVSVEQEVEMATVPGAAKDAIQKKAAGAEIKKVESVTEHGTVSYEATFAKKGKTSEYAVNADGTPKK
jgi:uncharacterized membrane protein YkoI